MKTSDSITTLSPALVAANGAITNVIKDSENPFFKSSYADLASVLDILRPAYAAQKLTLIQEPYTTDEGNFSLKNTILHESGEWIEFDTLELKIEVGKGSSLAQALGSLITYIRRYTAMGVSLMAAAGEDQDGNAASEKGGDTDQRPAKDPVKRISEADATVIRNLMVETDTNEAQYCKFLKVSTLEELPLSKLAAASDALNTKKRGMENNPPVKGASPAADILKGMKGGNK